MIHCIKVLFLCQKGENPNRILSFLVAHLLRAKIRFAQICRKEYPIPSGTAPCETKPVRIWTALFLVPRLRRGIIRFAQIPGREYPIPSGTAPCRTVSEKPCRQES